MVFIFVVESGLIIPNSNSYVTVEEADDYYVVDSYFAATWAALTEPEKEFRLVAAARFLDQRTEWNGYLVQADEQSMRWPRVGAYDRDGRAIPDDEIPEQLKHAVFEMAKYMIAKDPTVAQDVEFIKRAVLDVLEVEFQEGFGQISIPPLINSILEGLGNFQVGGHRFGKIVKV